MGGCGSSMAAGLFSRISTFGWFEFGFLWGIFFAPWGPVPRYLGWLISIVAWAVSRKERERSKGSMPPYFQWLLWALIGWAFLVTGLSGANLHDIIKGASNPVDAAFAMWLAASVLRREGAIRRCFLILWATTVLTGSWTIARYTRRLHWGLFRSISPGRSRTSILLAVMRSPSVPSGSA